MHRLIFEVVSNYFSSDHCNQNAVSRWSRCRISRRYFKSRRTKFVNVVERTSGLRALPTSSGLRPFAGSFVRVLYEETNPNSDSNEEGPNGSLRDCSLKYELNAPNREITPSTMSACRWKGLERAPPCLQIAADLYHRAKPVAYRSTSRSQCCSDDSLCFQTPKFGRVAQQPELESRSSFVLARNARSLISERIASLTRPPAACGFIC